MIDLKDLRQNPEKYRKGAADKNSHVDLDALLAVDAELREAMTRQQELTAEKNRIGKEIGQVAGRMKQASADEKTELAAQMKALQARPNELKAEESKLGERVRELEAERDALWLAVPQPADPDVPVGRSAEDNVELSRWSTPDYDLGKTFEQNRGFKPKTHIDLAESLGLVDFGRGVKIAGSRSYVLIGDGMRLHNAILRYAFDTMTLKNGFTPVSVADLVRHEMMVGTGFFPHGKDQVYDIANPTGDYGLALSGTGEVGLMGYHADEILDAESLPRCYTTLSTCFRREAGAAGKDTAGLYRIHQFDKVEQVVICRADEAESRAWHKKMIGFVEAMLRDLGLPYRLLQCCTGDLGPKNADMVDIECWMPGRGELGSDGTPGGDFGETHSASRLYDYQCRRLNTRYQVTDEKGKKQTVFCHSLNNTVAASPRILIPILEMYQNADGSVTVPGPLRPYMNGQDRIG